MAHGLAEAEMRGVGTRSGIGMLIHAPSRAQPSR